MPKSLKVAFGMEDDQQLFNGHYGDSKFFLIYEITEDGKIKFVENRENRAKYFEEEEHGDVRKFRAVMSQMEDVDILAAYRMGPNYLRIRDNTAKKVFFTRTRDFEKAMENLLKFLQEEGYVKTE